MLCDECLKRSDCQKLCAGAREYMRQDSVQWADTPVENFYFDGQETRVFNAITDKDKPFLTPSEKRFIRTKSILISRKKIAKKLNISIRTVDTYAHILRKKVRALEAFMKGEDEFLLS